MRRPLQARLLYRALKGLSIMLVPFACGRLRRRRTSTYIATPVPQFHYWARKIDAQPRVTSGFIRPRKRRAARAIVLPPRTGTSLQASEIPARFATLQPATLWGWYAMFAGFASEKKCRRRQFLSDIFTKATICKLYFVALKE